MPHARTSDASGAPSASGCVGVDVGNVGVTYAAIVAAMRAVSITTGEVGARHGRKSPFGLVTSGVRALRAVAVMAVVGPLLRACMCSDLTLSENSFTTTGHLSTVGMQETSRRRLVRVASFGFPETRPPSICGTATHPRNMFSGATARATSFTITGHLRPAGRPRT